MHAASGSHPTTLKLLTSVAVLCMTVAAVPAAAETGAAIQDAAWGPAAVEDEQNGASVLGQVRLEKPAAGDTVRRTFSLAQIDGDYDAGMSEPEAVAAEDGGYWPGLAVGAHVSTLGVGPSVSFPVSDFFVVNFSGNYFSFDQEDTIDDIRYNVDLMLATVGGTVDWHMFGGPLFISGGVFWNGNEAEFDATPAAPVEFGGIVLTPAQAGRIEGDVEFNDVAPFLGFGFDNTHRTQSRLSIYASFGVLYQGKPDVDVTVSGTANAIPGFAAILQREIDDVEDDLESLTQFFPVATIGLRWQF